MHAYTTTYIRAATKFCPIIRRITCRPRLAKREDQRRLCLAPHAHAHTHTHAHTRTHARIFPLTELHDPGEGGTRASSSRFRVGHAAASSAGRNLADPRLVSCVARQHVGQVMMLAGNTRPMWMGTRRPRPRGAGGGGEGTTAPVHPAGSGPGLPLFPSTITRVVFGVGIELKFWKGKISFGSGKFGLNEKFYIVVSRSIGTCRSSRSDFLSF